MSPAPTTSPSTTTVPPVDGSHSVRLRLKAAAPVSGYVDGGWWPRSRDLTAELPPMIAELGDRVGPVTRISFHLGAWEPAPRRLPTGPRLEGFRTTDPRTLTVVGRSGARLVLLVVPPPTDGPAAEAALDAAATAGDVRSPTDLLGDGPGASPPS
ncbi:DUF5994 family protein [Actinomycetospora cinnamomea]|uniref:Uncharacterized protein n=1 Tax=Actinomycetospora cinnamomea TaxID=663609 RepID=A0A2U1FRF6_9PSEU|nr:DUF5994 family protein [Actinomycetospora cinnamomea]PVZ14757.1 hypothetical protein C8D89_101625 [Actinomycetospora cinnamomea]